MARIWYGARTEEELRDREAQAASIGAWADSLHAYYETDPELIAQVLPPPLEPADQPLVRVTLASVTIGDRPPFGAGTVSVRAQHEGTVGDYALVMLMTTEQSVIGGRETFGEPKKIGQVAIDRDGDRVSGSMARMGTTFVEISGQVGDPLDPPTETTERVSFYYKFLQNPTGKGFDHEPALVYCYRDETAEDLRRVDGELALRHSRFDPVAELPVRKLVGLVSARRQTQQRAEIHSTIPSEWLLPYKHQRYDDMSPVPAKRS